LLRGDDPARDAQQPLRVADRRPAELHHERADAPRVVARDVGNGLVIGRRHGARKATWGGKRPHKMSNRLTRGPTGSTAGNLIGPFPEYKRALYESPQFARNTSHLATAGERATERDLVRVLEVAADGQPTGEPSDTDTVS